jgi:hypothetical protein
MSQALAFANGWNLAITLMVCVVVFHADAGNFGVMLAAEYDGDPAAVIHEFDPFPNVAGVRPRRREAARLQGVSSAPEGGDQTAGAEVPRTAIGLRR